jgi:3-phenylpropionate/trans-cinnamate dioxygenase alpha subunit
MQTHRERAVYLDMVDHEKGLIDRRIFSDPDIFEMEMEQIFARAWLFAAHDSQIPNPGDYVLNYFGTDRVIVVRDNDGQPQVLVNSCRHRGNAVCRADEGHASSFMCTYHGWTYDLKGALVGVPGFKEVYHEELDRENWGLIKAAQVDSYGGIIFATMDPAAPPLMEYLGDVGKLTIDYFNLAEHKRCIGNSKWSIPANWKFAADNIWDWYHVIFTHNSAGMAANAIRGTGNYAIRWSPLRRVNGKVEQREVVALGRYGHAIGGAGYIPSDPILISQASAEERAALGPVGAKMDGFGGIFPNLWISPNSIEWRIPVSPTRTEQWHIQFGKREGGNGGGVGPSSMFDQDDAENWGMSTAGCQGTVAKRYPLHYAMGIGHGEVIEIEGSPPHLDNDNWTEHCQRWHYRNWARWMAAEDWSELEDIIPDVPLGRM